MARIIRKKREGKIANIRNEKDDIITDPKASRKIKRYYRGLCDNKFEN